jgi:hypothetical protein
MTHGGARTLLSLMLAERVIRCPMVVAELLRDHDDNKQ